MEKIILRRAHKQDAEKILEVTRYAFIRYADEVRKREHIDALKETIDDVLADIENINVLVCELDDEITGCVRYTILEQGIAYLSRFAIMPEAQNLGIGGLLLSKVREECVKQDVRAIVLNTASRMRSTVAFYLKNGYYIHSINKKPDYIRALMVNELVDMDELFDYEAIVMKHQPKK